MLVYDPKTQKRITVKLDKSKRQSRLINSSDAQGSRKATMSDIRTEEKGDLTQSHAEASGFV